MFFKRSDENFHCHSFTDETYISYSSVEMSTMRSSGECVIFLPKKHHENYIFGSDFLSQITVYEEW